MMTNIDIIAAAADEIGFSYDGTNLRTFAEWKKAGKSVKKGETAFMKVSLWKPVKAKGDDVEAAAWQDNETGKAVKPEGSSKQKFIMKVCHLFRADQVEATKR